MPQHASDADLDRLSWHDNTIYGFRFDIGDSFQGDWHADLVLDIDHIVEWICATDGGARFRVAPATLTFSRRHRSADRHRLGRQQPP